MTECWDAEGQAPPPLGSRESAIREAMQMHELDQVAAETFVDRLLAVFEKEKLEGAGKPPRGIAL
jgi:hypothetical protein